MTVEGDHTGDRGTVLAGSQQAVANVKAIRKNRRITAEALAARCAELGAQEVTANVIWNLETGRRDLSLDTFLALALALDVPPMTLLVPTAHPESTVEVTPLVRTDAAGMAGWITGTTPLPGSDSDTFAEAAAALPRTAKTPDPPVDIEARTAWWAAQVNTLADDVAHRVADQVRANATQFVQQLSEYADTAPESPQSRAALQRVRSRLGLDPSSSQDHQD